MFAHTIRRRVTTLNFDFKMSEFEPGELCQFAESSENFLTDPSTIEDLSNSEY